MLEPKSYLSEAEEELKRRFLEGDDNRSRLPSTAADSLPSDRVDQLTLPDDMRPKMPYTKDKYLVKENPHLVQWEREVRKFQRRLSPDHGHRVTAVMVFEWATGLQVKDLMAANEARKAGRTNWQADLRKINKILKWYFGEPYMTWIMGRKVGKAYRIKPGYYIRRHRPMTLTLYAEYCEGTLNP